MRVFVTIPAAFLIAAMVQAPASAEEDCIKDVTGRTVCGADAEAVRVRMRFEEQFRRDGDATPAVESGPVTRPATTTTNVSAGMTTMDAKDALADDVLQTRQIDQPSQQELVFTAQADCIENAAGQTVCGAEAEAVRARIEAEEAYKNGAGDSYQRKASKRRRSGSVYSNFGQKVFLRGGYTFAASAGEPLVELEGSGLVGGIGYSRLLNRSGSSKFFTEGEVVYIEGDGDAAISIDTISFLTSLRWEYDVGGVSPFVSGGVGLAYLRATSPLTTVTDNSINFAYTGRAGIVTSVSHHLSLEAAYRFAGALNSGLLGNLSSHSAEIGLNYDF